MTWSRKGNAIHVKSQRSLKERVFPVLVGSSDNGEAFRRRVSTRTFHLNSSHYVLVINHFRFSYRPLMFGQMVSHFTKHILTIYLFAIVQIKMLGFKSIRRRQGDEYFYNNDVNQCSLQKLFKKNQAGSSGAPAPILKKK